MNKSDLIELAEDMVEEKSKKFDTLLDQIENTSDKKRELWKQIYHNATQDRHNAFILFEKLYRVCLDDTGKMLSTEMAVHGKQLAQFLTNMSKCTDQLGKLADLISQEETKTAALNVNDAYAAIGEQK